MITKLCPGIGCGQTLGRTQRECPKCGHQFVSDHLHLDRMRRTGTTAPPAPRRRASAKPEALVMNVEQPAIVVPAAALPASLAIALPSPLALVVVFEPDDFDCVAMPGGRLRLVLPSGEVILSARQAKIVAIELAIA